jgi:hypothetical protein
MKKYLVVLLAAFLTACGGGGGGSSTPANPSNPSTPSNPSNPSQPSNPTPATPIPVQKSSYLNKITAAAAIGPQSLPSEVSAGNAVAFADFFQDGTYSMVTHSLEYNSQDPSTVNKYGHIHFYKKVNGAWVDHTSDILSNNVGCLHPRKAVVADFNGDGKPDVFFACHGFDAPPFSGEQPHILLSQPNGQYTNVTLPFTGFFHSASAADFNGNGHADVVVVDPIVSGMPYFLVNNGDGTFTKSTTRLTCAACKNTQIYTTELIDFNNTGKFDLFLAGTAPDGNANNPNPFIPTIFKNAGDNTFTQASETQLPYNPQYETTLDVLTVNGAIYTTNVHLTYGPSVYGYSDIEKTVGSNSSQIYVGNSQFPGGGTWINWIIPFQGKIDSMNADYGVSVTQ